jgi:CheY-like chemotaxis protein
VQRILVVDDDPAIRDALAFLLEDAGYGVRTAPDGQAALAVVAQGACDLVITDLAMPRLDGTALIARLRHERPGLPLLVLSAGIRVAPPPGVPFVAKPFAAERLLAAVARLLTPP